MPAVRQRGGATWKQSRERLLVGATVLIAIALCALAMLGYFAIRAYRNPFPKGIVAVEGDWIMDTDEEIGFVPARNGRSKRTYPRISVSQHFYTDARRARVNAPGEQTPPPVDVIFIGCSFTWGHGIENPDTFAQLIRTELGVTVANFGMGSYSTLNSAQMLRRNFDLKPRAVVYSIIKDHLRRNLSPCAPNYSPYCLPASYVAFDPRGNPYAHPPHHEYFSPSEDRSFFRDVMTSRRFGLLDIWWRMKIDLFKYKAWDSIAYPNDSDSRGKAMVFAIDEMISVATGAGAKLVVAYIPDLKPEGKESFPPSEVLNAVRGKDLTFIDFSPGVRRYYASRSRPPLAIPGDDHPSVAGARFIADGIKPVLKQILGKSEQRSSAPAYRAKSRDRGP